MNVLLITTTYPTPAHPHQGAFNRVLVEALGARHDVRIIAPIPWTQVSRGTCDASDGSRTLHPTYYYPPKMLRERHDLFYWWSIGRSLARLERRFSPDVVMGYWLHPDGAAALRAAERFRVPSIVMSGGTDLRLLPRDARRRQAISRVLETTDRVIVFSRELAVHAYRLGVPPDKLEVVYRGVDRRVFQPGRPGGVAPCVRHTAACRGHRVGRSIRGRQESGPAPAAAVRWKREWGDALRVILAGDGPLRKQLVQLRKQLGLQDAVVFAGNLTQTQLALHFGAADLTVLTSHSEGIPNVLLESIACGARFVATDVGGIAEIASPGMDRLVPAGNVSLLADAVIECIRTVPERRRTFMPTDLAGMAAQFDAVLERQPGTSRPWHRGQHAATRHPRMRRLSSTLFRDQALMDTNEIFSNDTWPASFVVAVPSQATARKRLTRVVEIAERRVLLVSYAFPPTGGGGVQRAVKFAKYLPHFGWRPTILTVANPSVPVHDHDLAADLDPHLQIVRARHGSPDTP